MQPLNVIGLEILPYFYLSMCFFCAPVLMSCLLNLTQYILIRKVKAHILI